MFSKILIANRGEIAVRIIKTCRRLGIATVAVYSDADEGSLAVKMADEAVHIGPPAAAQSYLQIDRIIRACKDTGAQAVHPGYGFLSENAVFAEQLKKNNIAFIGPNVRAVQAMGDKIESKAFAAKAGVSTIPGSDGEVKSTRVAVKLAEQIGFPVMIKASAGGGGKGMRIAHTRREVMEGIVAARNEARKSFGDDRVFIEKFVVQPRHIEIQVLGDKHGNVVSLNERECSIQRRNQKVIEEAPSPFVTPELRARMSAQAVALSKAVDYDSAGTVEFIVDKDRNFYFLEMNTRLQVEHPVTELITGLDLVEQMIRVAAGEPLSFTQKDVRLDGWAIESRVYAEDPYRNYAPSTGRLVRYEPPPEGDFGDHTIRNDAGVTEGDAITPYYDPMIAKLCAWAPMRDAAVAGMAAALDQFQIQGVAHNIPLLSAIMGEPRFQSGDLSTAYLAEVFPDGFKPAPPVSHQKDLLTAAAVWAAEATASRLEGAGKRPADWIVMLDDERHPVRIERNEPDAFEIRLPQENRAIHLDADDWSPGEGLMRGRLDGAPFTVNVQVDGPNFTLRHRAASTRARVVRPHVAELYTRLPKRVPLDRSNLIVSPMPGLVVAVEVTEGQTIKAGQALIIVEAMKMENLIRAERDGKVKQVAVAAGDIVAADQLLIEMETDLPANVIPTSG